jgi:hypothetical protein
MSRASLQSLRNGAERRAAAEDAIGIFFASDGQLIAQPEPAEFFEVPVAGPLLETLNYIQ